MGKVFMLQYTTLMKFTGLIGIHMHARTRTHMQAHAHTQHGCVLVGSESRMLNDWNICEMCDNSVTKPIFKLSQWQQKKLSSLEQSEELQIS